ncbi:hypothetical protein Alide_1686 [Alicycliphilus denitrificans BC]|nr:hypothetical protein Alide_1686 [Alicycliphilus denitrificans BC]
MRKISHKRQMWLLRRQRVWCKGHKFLAGVAKTKTKPKIKRDVLVAPGYFCLASSNNVRSEASAQFLAFLRSIRDFRGSGLCIDMSRVQRMVANATLLFKAELSYQIQRGVSVGGVMPRKARTHQVLTQTGLTRMLGLPECKHVDREDTVHWRHASGSWSVTQPSHLSSLLGGNEQQNALLYTGMIESVANCIEHAYREHPKRRAFGAGHDGWWGFQQLRDGVLSTCICDLGIGIARSLPLKLADEPTLYKKLVALFNHLRGDDVRGILAAIEYGRSSTGLVQRGKGLRDAHRVIDDAGEGHFHIFSNQGMYIYRKERGKEPTSGTRRLAESIEGTIYYWQYPLQSQGAVGVIPIGGVLS